MARLFITTGNYTSTTYPLPSEVDVFAAVATSSQTSSASVFKTGSRSILKSIIRLKSQAATDTITLYDSVSGAYAPTITTVANQGVGDLLQLYNFNIGIPLNDIWGFRITSSATASDYIFVFETFGKST